MHVHILGICGTFMGGLAAIAQQAGHRVTGSDEHIYPPMSEQLQQLGITLQEGYSPAHLQPPPDKVIIGNALSRGNSAVEYILEKNIPYTSGPQWLAENILQKYWVLAVAGTHGKTTTASLLTWIFKQADLSPGFLIGGVPLDFSVSAGLGEGPYFIIEADEYDSAFFDKRSKFIHYHPKTLILNNLEFDHADIFADLAAIEQQFHFLLRTVPGNGQVIYNYGDEHLSQLLQRGCWTPKVSVGIEKGDWSAKMLQADGSEFDLLYQGEVLGTVQWTLLGRHNVSNALSAMAAATHAGIAAPTAITALNKFSGIKRRLEVKATVQGITVYDDFAHHPTAIATTLEGLRQRVGDSRIIAVVEFGSYTMKTGVHRDSIIPALAAADLSLLLKPEQEWGLSKLVMQSDGRLQLCANVDETIKIILQQAQRGDHILIMSNKGFAGGHDKLCQQLAIR